MKGFVLILCVSIFTISGCIIDHYVSVCPTTEPTAKIYLKEKNKPIECYTKTVTYEDEQAGEIKIPTMILKREGYMPHEFNMKPIKLDSDFWNNVEPQSFNYVLSFRHHKYTPKEAITLQLDPNYLEPEIANHLKVKVYSEPQGAEIYQREQKVCTTPCTLDYSIRARHYQTGVMTTSPLKAKMEGYLEQEINSEFIIQNDWKYSSNSNFNADKPVMLALLRDPNYEGPKNSNNLKVKLNSEPQGARIYQDGNQVCTTPCTLDYTLSTHHYKTGAIRSKPLTAVFEGYLPQEKQSEFPVDSDWKYSSSKTFTSSKALLFLLNPDPNYRVPVVKSPQATPEKRYTHSTEAHQIAQAEYDVALENYNKAIKKLNDARTKGHVGGVLSSANRSNPNPWAQLSALALPVMNAAEIRDAEQEVEIAWQRLEKTKAQLNYTK